MIGDELTLLTHPSTQGYLMMFVLKDYHRNKPDVFKSQEQIKNRFTIRTSKS